MAGLDSLSPARRTQYEALLPEIQRSSRNAANARGGFYSGAAIDAETRAEADLLAKLAGLDASEQAAIAEGERNRESERNIRAEDRKAANTANNKNLIGSGVSSLMQLIGAYQQSKNAGGQVVPLPGGSFGLFNPSDKTITPIPMGGKPGVGGDTLAQTAPTGLAALGTADNPEVMGIAGPVSYGRPAASPPPIASPAASPGVGATMWKNATSGGAGGTAARAAGALGGGFAGSELARRAAGRGGLGTDIGAALGGLGGAGAGAYYGGRNKWGAGLGALLGSFGGGLLGNLFR